MMRVFHGDGGCRPELLLRQEVTQGCAGFLEQGARRYEEALREGACLSEWQSGIKEAMRGAFPAELFTRPPCPASKLVSRFTFDGFSVENRNIASLYGRQANASIFLPAGGGDVRRPVVITPTGHSAKIGRNYQLTAQLFAKCGYIAVLFDSIGQGEQAFGNDHFYCGATGYLVDVWSQTHFVGDALCVMDYMQQRDDVDASRGFAMTGCSGGGTTTLYCAALDDRVSASAPVCCISPHRRLHLEDLYTTCPECFGKGYLRAGIDMADYLAAQAPKPMLVVCGSLDDVFLEADTRAAYERAARAYGLLGKRGSIGFFADKDSPHGYSKAMAIEAARFFHENFLPCRALPGAETQLAMLDADKLAGRPAQAPNMFEINRQAASRFRAEREARREVWQDAACGGREAGPAAAQEAAREAVQGTAPDRRQSCLEADGMRQTLAGLLDFDMPPAASRAASGTIVETLPLRWERQFEKIRVKGDGAIETPGIFAYDPLAKEKKPLLVFADDCGKFAGFARNGFLSRACGLFADAERLMPNVLSIELAGFGELKNENTPYDTSGWNDIDRILSYLAAGCGRPIPHYWAQAFFDSLRYMRAREPASSDALHLGGRGCGALAALLSAALGAGARKLVLIDMPASYEHMAQTLRYKYNDMIVIPGILRHFDLPEIMAALKGTEILLVDPRDGDWGALAQPDAERLYGGGARARVLCGASPSDIAKAVAEFVA
ncbi:MAG: prolyl oligopeptidase family serine peptidase [Clostridiales bacterium]|jgi:dienelactone hydrolase|nr:prolyl oligopeptidase family serine peptidase [Clostridiales bacterium]